MILFVTICGVIFGIFISCIAATYNPKRSVGAAAALLDWFKSDWYESIVPERLDMSCEYNCVLGQVYGNYIKGRYNLGILSRILERAFSPPPCVRGETTNLWIKHVKVRLNAA